MKLLWSYLKEHMKRYPDRMAFADLHLTYADILRLDEQTAGQGKPCICVGQNRTEHAIAILRCLAAGDVAVPYSHEYGIKLFEYISQAIDGVKEGIDDLAFIMFTSGTTGKPKGVMLTDENIITNLEYISTYFKIDHCRNICIARPLVHIAVLTGELLYALCNGLTIHFYEEPFMPKRLLSYLQKNEIDIFCATPTLYNELAKINRGDVNIKVGAISGEVLIESIGKSIAAAFPCAEFYNVYGLTEHSPRVSALLPTEFAKRPHSIGKPIGEVKVKIESGELLIKSPCVMKGYFKDARLTAEKLRDGWLHTGDMAHTDADGFLYIDGRKDNMMIRSGLNVYPEEIELAAKECSGIDDCIAYGENTEHGMMIHLKYVGEIEPSELRKRLKQALNPVIIPNKIERVEQISRTASGKKIRK